jgi:hypothetical protein
MLLYPLMIAGCGKPLELIPSECLSGQKNLSGERWYQQEQPLRDQWEGYR